MRKRFFREEQIIGKLRGYGRFQTPGHGGAKTHPHHISA